MPKIFNARSFMTLMSLLILLLGACGAPQGGPSQGGGTPVKGGSWIDDLYEEPDSLLGNASSETFAWMVDQTIYTPLFVGDSKGQLHPALTAEIPTVQNGGVSSDLKTWTFHLRKGLKWSDGQPLDARDVDYTWKTWVNPKYGANSTIGFNLITSADVSIAMAKKNTHNYAPGPTGASETVNNWEWWCDGGKC